MITFTFYHTKTNDHRCYVATIFFPFVNSRFRYGRQYRNVWCICLYQSWGVVDIFYYLLTFLLLDRYFVIAIRMCEGQNSDWAIECLPHLRIRGPGYESSPVVRLSWLKCLVILLSLTCSVEINLRHTMTFQFIPFNIHDHLVWAT